MTEKISQNNVLYLKCSKFLSSLIRQPLTTALLLANLEKSYCLLSSITGSNFLLSHTLMILDGQILVFLKYLLTLRKPNGRYSLFVNSIYVWNHLQSCSQNVIFHQLRANELIEILITFFLNRHN